jgi:drug/metabolite transporter (DMT)-like permease
VAELGAGTAASYISLVPVFGVASAVVLLGEPMTASLLIGGALALAGVVIANRARR